MNLAAKVSDPERTAVRIGRVSTGRVRGSVVTLPVRRDPYTASYEAVDRQGGVAIGVIHVPGRAGGAPFVRPGSAIRIGSDSKTTVRLSDYVVVPSGKHVRLTTTDHLISAPARCASPSVPVRGER